MTKLVFRLKGGKGSGFHGHAGRPGKLGGSTAGRKLPYQMSVADYVKVENQEVDTGGLKRYMDVNNLPPVAEGKRRVFHGTSINNLKSIAETGVLTGKEAGRGEQIPAILGSGVGPSGFGDVSIVMDLPEKDVRFINDSWTEVYRRVLPKEIVGVIVHSTRKSVLDLIGEHKRLIEEAIAAGKSVPESVIRNYTDLAKKYLE